MSRFSQPVSRRTGASIVALGVVGGLSMAPAVSVAQSAFAPPPPPVVSAPVAPVGGLATSPVLPAAPSAVPVSAGGAVVSDIVVRGNQRVEAATVVSYMTVRAGQPATPGQINASVRALFETGLFRDVSITPEGSRLIVTVDENPVVNEIAFEGNDRIPDEVLSGGITSRERRVFTRAKAEADAETILDAYRRSGRYAASVEPKIIELPQNRVDLVFEIEEGPLTGVSSIRFVGNEAFSDRRLRRAIATDESSLLNFLSATDSFDPDRLELDKELLRRFYLSRGYVDMEVSSAVAELDPDGSGFFITFTITEGEPYRFGPLTVVSDVEGVDADALASLIQPDEGDFYDVREVEETISLMTDRLGEEGYAFTEIRPVPDKDDEAGTIGLSFEVNEGPRVFVERIDIVGNSRTLDRVIRREFELAEGDAFNAVQLRRARGRIRGLGFFKTVDVRTERGSAPDRIVVTTEVEEQSTGQLSFGVGFSTSENVSGEFSIIERNLLGRGQALRLRARLSGRTQLYDLSFTEPAFLDRDVAVGVDIYRRETDNQDTSSFDVRNTGIQPRVSFPLGRYSRLTPRYRLSQDEIRDVPESASPLIRRDEGEAITSSIGYELVYDRRTDPVQPDGGYILRLEQDIAGLGGDAQYLRNEASAKAYTEVFYDDVIGSLEVAGGAIVPFGGYDLKASDRFFLGGDSLRGFETAGLGPRDQFTDDTVGGEYYAVARAELTFPLGLPEEYGLAGGLFADVGTVWNLDDNTYIDTRPADPATGFTPVNNGNPVSIDDGAELRAAVGATIFWTSPFGPVRLNFATPILEEDGDDTEFFRFSAGTRF